MTVQTAWEKFKSLWSSRKFWVLLGSLVTTWGAYILGDLDIVPAVYASVASFCLFSTGVALEDAGRNIGMR